MPTILEACSPVYSLPPSFAAGAAINDTVNGVPYKGNIDSSSSTNSSSRSQEERELGEILPVAVDIRRLSVKARPSAVATEEEERTGRGVVPREDFVSVFRDSAPYIRAHQGAVMVAHIGGDVVEKPDFFTLMDDWRLLCLLGVKLVLVTGARPQISSLLEQAGITEEFRDGTRITSPEALKVVKAAAGYVRIEVEGALTRGGRGSNYCSVSGGNYYSAQPVGVKNGIDYKCAGVVRRVDTEKINSQLKDGDVVQLTCIGYSASGEVFNVDSRDLAAKCAAALGAEKLIYVYEGAQLEDAGTGEVIQSLRLSEARSMIARYRRETEMKRSATGVSAHSGAAGDGREKDESLRGVSDCGLEGDFVNLLERSVHALSQSVPRAHVVPPVCGALLQELYTRDGCGLLISRDIYDGIRRATPSDIPGITEITAPLEENGVLVPRPLEQLEADINRKEYYVITRDGAVLGVAFFRRYGRDHGEIGCLAIHHEYRQRGWGEAMLSYLERLAIAYSVKHVFVLSSRTMQWFVERGFEEASVSDLPKEREYNWERMSKIYGKTLGGGNRGVDAEELLWDVRGMI